MLLKLKFWIFLKTVFLFQMLMVFLKMKSYNTARRDWFASRYTLVARQRGRLFFYRTDYIFQRSFVHLRCVLIQKKQKIFMGFYLFFMGIHESAISSLVYKKLKNYLESAIRAPSRSPLKRVNSWSAATSILRFFLRFFYKGRAFRWSWCFGCEQRLLRPWARLGSKS